MSRRLLVALAVAGLRLVATGRGARAGRPRLPAGRPGEGRGQVVYAGIWIATGLVALQRRPGNRVGLLMAALGFAVDLADSSTGTRPCRTRSFTALSEPRAGDHGAPLPRVPERSARDELRTAFWSSARTAPGSSWLPLAGLSCRDPRGTTAARSARRTRFVVVDLDTVAPVVPERRRAVSSSVVFVVTGRLARAEGASRARGDASRARPRAPDERRRDPPVRPGT